MKKPIALILCCLFLLSFTACNSEDSTDVTLTPPETQGQSEAVDLTAEISKKVKVVDFEGIVYLTHNGEVLYSCSDGKNEKGGELTPDTPVYIGSVSKQFCAAAIMMLCEQGKLSVEDTLDKYFPEYEIGRDITLKNLLSMRSGIPDNNEETSNPVYKDKSESENLAIMKEWIFSQPLDFEPDTAYAYSNSNYLLLALVAEQVTGQYYQDFIRDNIFEPVGMTSSGFIYEVESNPDFSQSLSYDSFVLGEDAAGLVKGMGDIVSTACDMDKWMTALKSGKVVSMESFEEMKADHSPDYGMKYGYGLKGLYKGTGHGGLIGSYWTLNYMSNEGDYNLFVAGIDSNELIERLPELIMSVVLDE